MLKLSSCEVRRLKQCISCNLAVTCKYISAVCLILLPSVFAEFSCFSQDGLGSCLRVFYHVYGRSARISADRNALLSPIEFSSPGIKIGV